MSGTTKFTYTPEPNERVRYVKDPFGLTLGTKDIDMDLYRFRVEETSKETAWSLLNAYKIAASLS
jgi:hypothetical protein